MFLQSIASRARRLSAAVPTLLFTCSLLASATAWAQQIKGRVMVMVDTSGSMVYHFANNNSCGGDGDALSRYTDINQANKNYYPGNTVNGQFDGPNSRLYGAKAALTNVVNATGDLDFGLMRYAPAAISKNNCQNATNCCNFATPGCVTYGSYAQNGGKLNWEGGCGTSANGIVTDGGQLLVLPGSGSDLSILGWVDGIEDFRDNGGGSPMNPELRANGSTPLAGSARTAYSKWYEPIYQVSKVGSANYNPQSPLFDPQLDCRPYVLVMMTDGADTCDGNSNTGPPAAVQTLHAANPANPVLTYLIGLAFMNGDPAITVLNNMAANGGTGSARFANNQSSIEAAFGDIVASSVKTELCNGKDDNCNGLIDEGFDKGANCTVGLGACQRSGIEKCDPNNDTQTTCCVNDGNPNSACVALVAGTPRPEICNGIDDDCNGIVDDPPVCQTPMCFPETCNGKDDDCDGVIDNDLIDIGRVCGLNIGQCMPGVTTCLNSKGQDVSQQGIVADAKDMLVCQGAILPKPEVCDGYDNDCDGVVDGMTRACYDGPQNTDNVGVCHSGAQPCTATLNSGIAMWGACVGEVLPSPEICNGLDDDCDGKVDDVMGQNVACCPSGKCGVGICVAGTTQCSGGALACAGGVGPKVETCNGVDDDCDGKVDDLPNIGFACVAKNGCQGTLQCDVKAMVETCVPAQQSCGMGGACAGAGNLGQPCGAGAGLPLPCMAGVWTCVNGQVVCKGGVAPATEVCNCIDDDCNGKVDDSAVCPGGTACIACQCLGNCGGGEFPCPGGFDCVQSNCKVDGDCPPGNKCTSGSCDPGYCAPELNCKPACVAPLLCENGACVDPCAGVQCAAGTICDQGSCVTHDCVTNPEICQGCENGAGQRCDATQKPPACVVDLCCGVSCGATQMCDQGSGKCVNTCRAVSCGIHQVCTGGQCVANCTKECPDGQFCDPKSDACVIDDPACAGVECSGVNVCCHGQCAANPCSADVCSDGYRCRALPDCTTVCEPIPLPDQDTVVGAGGGGFAFGCAMGTGSHDASNEGGSNVIGLCLGCVALFLVRRRVWSQRGSRSLRGR